VGTATDEGHDTPLNLPELTTRSSAHRPCRRAQALGAAAGGRSTGSRNHAGGSGRLSDGKPGRGGRGEEALVVRDECGDVVTEDERGGEVDRVEGAQRGVREPTGGLDDGMAQAYLTDAGEHEVGA